MGRSAFLRFFILLVALSMAHVAYATDLTCKVIDLMPEFWRVVDMGLQQSPEQQVQTFRAVLVAKHPDLFGANGLGFNSASELDAAIVRSLAVAHRNEKSIRAMSDLLESQLPSYLATFKRAFPDFRCDFPIYIVSSLNQMDGAGRVVDNKPALILGVDVIAVNHTPASLAILVHHELFHRYHYQVAGFSDDKAERDVIWRSLWAEGLATYVSKQLNSPATMQDALFVPTDLVARARPMLKTLILGLEPKLDSIDADYFSQMFKYHGAAANPPSRVGYYIGALAAEKMAQRHSLLALAHLRANAVRQELGQALFSLAEESAGK